MHIVGIFGGKLGIAYWKLWIAERLIHQLQKYGESAMSWGCLQLVVQSLLSFISIEGFCI